MGVFPAVVLALVGGYLIGKFVMTRGDPDATKPPAEKTDEPDAPILPDFTEGVPDDDTEALTREAGTGTGLDPGELTFEATEAIDESIGQAPMMGADVAKDTRGEQWAMNPIPAPSFGATALFCNKVRQLYTEDPADSSPRDPVVEVDAPATGTFFGMAPAPNADPLTAPASGRASTSSSSAGDIASVSGVGPAPWTPPPQQGARTTSPAQNEAAGVGPAPWTPPPQQPANVETEFTFHYDVQ